MNNKHIYLATAAATMLAGLAACSSDELSINGNGTEGLVTFTAQLPAGFSRAYGDGTTVDSLEYAVYENGASTPLAIHNGLTVGKAAFNGLTAQVSVNLAQGKKYDFVFWAANSTAPYTFDATTKSVTADYSNVTSSDETLDAFYGTSTIEVKGATSGSVTLTRPFAQINVCTTDKAAAKASGFDATHTTVLVKGVNNVLNLATGVASGNVDVTFQMDTIAAGCSTDKHDQLSMNYVLVGSDRTTVDIEHTTHHKGSTTSVINGTYTAVPVQANYKTHIYGALLTNPIEYTVTINPAFNTPDNGVEIWDGSSMTEPQLNEAGDAYEITNPSEFAYFLNTSGVVTQSAAAKSRATAVKTFTLTDDLDMGGNTLPVPAPNSLGVYQFGDVTVNGNGYTIRNFKTANDGVNTGIFPLSVGLTVSDLNIENATIGSANPNGDAYAGVIGGTAYGATITNVTVSNSTVNGVNKVGGILGFAAENIAKITGCSVESTTINGIGEDAGCVGGILGYVGAYKEEYGAYLKDCSVANITVNVPKGEPKASRGNAYIVGTVGAKNGSQHPTTAALVLDNCTISGDNTLVSNFTCNQYVGSDRYGNSGDIIVNDETISISADYYVATVDALKALATNVNDGTNTYSGKTVILAADLDLNNEDWTPIGKVNSFQGTFDGCGHTISNLKINKVGDYNVGLFGYTTNGAVKNLNIHNAQVTGRMNVGVVCGTPYTSAYSNITLTGDIKVDGKFYVGGMFGKNLYKSADNLTINANAGSYVNSNSIEGGVGYRCYVGGVVGFMGEGDVVVSNVTSNINVNGNVCDVGGITGIAHYGNTFRNCTCTGDVTMTDADADQYGEIGGIAGVWHNEDGTTVTFENCSFTGTLSCSNGDKTYDVSGNTIVGSKYSANGTGTLLIQ